MPPPTIPAYVRVFVCGHCFNTFVFGEADGERDLLDLGSKQVHLVEEKNDGGVHKSTVIDNLMEQGQALMHTVLNK